jgi:hypothetical protein
MTDEVTQNEAPDLSALNQNNTTQQSQAQQESADLNVNDLNGMKTIIDLASSRGAFKPNEMMAVGQIYMKLSNFLASVQKQGN